mgnify:CR=1 FL=1|tara:strand:- start:21936 stop:22562 length:627 start_codon:yes stop_codon:yes gene_type:complete
MKKNSIEEIAKLLPDGLSEDLLEKIASLVHTKIVEEVNTKTADLTVKVKAYLRGQIERIKEQAVKELELENPVFRSAQLFESVKSLFVTELTEEDEVNAINLMAFEQDNLGKKINVLAGELNKSLKESVDLKKHLKVLLDKNKLLESKLVSNEQSLRESKSLKVMENQGIAQVVSKENFQRQGKLLESKKPETVGNVFLSEDSLRLMR